MGSRKGKKIGLADDAPWRKQLPSLAVRETPNANYALSIMKHPDPIGKGLAAEAFLEAAGPECLVPGQIKNVNFFGLQVWPINMNFNLNFMKPVAREMKTVSKILDTAFDVMDASFGR